MIMLECSSGADNPFCKVFYVGSLSDRDPRERLKPPSFKCLTAQNFMHRTSPCRNWAWQVYFPRLWLAWLDSLAAGQKNKDKKEFFESKKVPRECLAECIGGSGQSNAPPSSECLFDECCWLAWQVFLTLKFCVHFPSFWRPLVLYTVFVIQTLCLFELQRQQQSASAEVRNASL